MESLPEKVDAWTEEDVAKLFDSIRLSKYCQTVRDEGITGSMLKYLIEHDGLGDVGLSKLEQARLVNLVRPRIASEGESKAEADVNAAATPAAEEQKVDNKEEDRARIEAEMREKMEAQMKAEVKAQLQAKLEAEMKEKMEAEMRQKKIEAEARAKAAEAELQAKMEEEKRIEAEKQAKAKEEMQAQAEIERKAKLEAAAEAEIKAKRDLEMKAKAEETLRAQMEADMKAKVEAEMRAKLELEMKAKVEAELKAEVKATTEATAKTTPAAKPVPVEPKITVVEPEPPIFEAVRSGDEALVCSLLLGRADPNALDDFGGPPLDLAISFKSHQFAALLLSSRADPAASTVGMPRNDGVMFELLTNSQESMELEYSYFCHHKSDEWREARQILLWARTRLANEEKLKCEREKIENDLAEEKRIEAAIEADKQKKAAEKSMTAQYRQGDKVRLSKEGCEAPPGYDWSDEVMRPGDVGEVLTCRVIQGVLDIFLRGPRGRTDSYDAIDIEHVM